MVQLSTLHCLQPLLLDAPLVVSLHVDTLVGKFLSLTDSPAMVSPRWLPPLVQYYSFPFHLGNVTNGYIFALQAIRIAALQCLHALASLPTPVVSGRAAYG